MTGFLTRMAQRSLAAATPAEVRPEAAGSTARTQLLLPRPVSLFEPSAAWTPEADGSGPMPGDAREDAERPADALTYRRVASEEPENKASRMQPPAPPEPERARSPAGSADSGALRASSPRASELRLGEPLDAGPSEGRRSEVRAPGIASPDKRPAGVESASAAPEVAGPPDGGTDPAASTSRPRESELAAHRALSDAARVDLAKDPATAPRARGEVVSKAPLSLPTVTLLPRRVHPARSDSPWVGGERHAPEERVVHVTIGRVEVRAVPETQASPRTRPASATRPAVSLDAYLRRRGLESRR